MATLGGASLATPVAAAAPAAPAPAASAPGSGRTREYWLQADSFEHNLVPTGYDEMGGQHFKSDQTTIWAVGYRAYTSGWGEPLKGDGDIGPNTGIPGPVLRGAVGDTIVVHFRNADTRHRFPHSIHPHGVRYTPESDGAWLAVDPDKAGTAVPPGGTYTYTWTCRPDSVGTWLYHDHSKPQSLKPGGDPVMEMGAELGLFGIIAVTDAQTPPVDREFFLFFHDLYADEVPSIAQDLDCFNGRAFLGNTPTFSARVGEQVRWRIAALGKEFHVFHIHGHRWKVPTGFGDCQTIGPAETLTVEYTEDNPGDWLYHCHVSEHMMGGMVGRYKVSE